MESNKQLLQYKQLSAKYDYLAPDASEIRLLSEGKESSMCHCTLPRDKISSPVKHKTIEEIWYIIEGNGEIWLKNEQQEFIYSLSSGISISIPLGYSFQFRNTGIKNLCIVIVSTPAWPGNGEAIPLNEGKW